MDDLIEKCGYCKMRISDMNPGDCFVRDKDGLKYVTSCEAYTHHVCFKIEGYNYCLPLYLFDKDETVLPYRLSKETLMQIKDNKMIDIAGNISIQNIYKRIYGEEFDIFAITGKSDYRKLRYMEAIVYLLQEFKLIEAKYKFDFTFGDAKIYSIDFENDFKSKIDVIFDIKVKWTTRVKEILDLLQDEIENESRYAEIFYARKEYYGDLYKLSDYLRNHITLNCGRPCNEIEYLSDMFQRAQNFGIQFKKEEEKAKPKEEPQNEYPYFDDMIYDYYVDKYGLIEGQKRYQYYHRYPWR